MKLTIALKENETWDELIAEMKRNPGQFIHTDSGMHVVEERDGPDDPPPSPDEN